MMTHESWLGARRVGWLIVVAGTLAAPWARATVGGSPTDKNSCYSDCDVTAVGPNQSCYCDALCEQFGDCCGDKHEYCAPIRAKPICGLVDDRKNGLAGSQVCGTDLGASFIHDGRIEAIFGDSFEYRSPSQSGGGSCIDHGDIFEGGRGFLGDYNDDSQGRFASGTARPSWVPETITGYNPIQTNCRSLTPGLAEAFEFDSKPMLGGNGAYTYRQIRLRGSDGEDISLGILNTPLAAFSDGLSAYAMFVAAPRSEMANCGLAWELCKHVYIAKRRGEANSVDRTQYDVIADLDRIVEAGGTTKFLNTTAARVTSVAGELPGEAATALNNFDLPQDLAGPPKASAGGEMLIWGRPFFKLMEAQASDANPVYLARLHVTQGTNGGLKGSAWYFHGFALNFEPMWTPYPSLAVPVISEDFKVSSQFDIKWIKELRKWVMLYGGDVPDYANPPVAMDQPRHGAIHMRTADFPWGPWSRPTPLLWREAMGYYFQCDARPNTNPPGCDNGPTYLTGDWEQNSMTEFLGFQGSGGDCQRNHPQPAWETNDKCLGQSMRGNLYAPNLLPSWTRYTPAPPGGLGATTLYFTTSTLYPYSVVLAGADLALPNNRYPLKMQLRHATTSKMIGTTTGTSPAPVMTKIAGGANGGSVAFIISKVGSGDQPRSGDTVVLRNTSNGNRLLTRVAAAPGTALAYIPDTNNPPANAQWVLQHLLSPVEAEIIPGATLFLLRSVGAGTVTPRYLGWSGAGAPTVTDSPSSAHVWKFTYHCQTLDPDDAGPAEADTCAR